VKDYLDREQLLKSVSDLGTKMSDVGGHRTVMFSDNKVYMTSQTGQTAFWMRPSSKLDNILLHAVRSRVVAVESKFPGSGEICGHVFSRAVREWIRREKAGWSPYSIKTTLEIALHQIENARPLKRRLRVEDVSQMLSRTPSDVSEPLTKLILAAPLGCLVAVKKSRTSSTSIKVSHGTRISAMHMRGSSSEVVNPKVVLIDGAIDTVGQIHRVLEDASQSGTHYLIGCRSATEEVERTVSLNCSRGTINVLIFFARLDDLTIGALDDVSACTGASIIGAQLGESVSTHFDRFRNISGRFWAEHGILRSDSPPHESLQRHLQSLREDSERSDQSVQDFLMSRILGLSSHRLEVYLGESESRRDPIAMEVIDTDVRTLAASFSRGVSTDIADVQCDSWVSSTWDGAILRPMCAGSIEAGIVSGIRCAIDLCSAGCAVIS
jgi:hypothetical protein